MHIREGARIEKGNKIMNTQKVLNDADFLKWAQEVTQPMQYARAEEGLKALRKTAHIYRKHEQTIEAAAKQISGQ